jgi:hypothetical protein
VTNEDAAGLERHGILRCGRNCVGGDGLDEH